MATTLGKYFINIKENENKGETKLKGREGIDLTMHWSIKDKPRGNDSAWHSLRINSVVFMDASTETFLRKYHKCSYDY